MTTSTTDDDDDDGATQAQTCRFHGVLAIHGQVMLDQTHSTPTLSGGKRSVHPKPSSRLEEPLVPLSYPHVHIHASAASTHREAKIRAVYFTPSVYGSRPARDIRSFVYPRLSLYALTIRQTNFRLFVRSRPPYAALNHHHHSRSCFVIYLVSRSSGTYPPRDDSTPMICVPQL